MTIKLDSDGYPEETYPEVDPETVGDDDLFVALFEDVVPLNTEYATAEEFDLPELRTIALAQGRQGILRTMVNALEEWLNERLPSFRDPRTPASTEAAIARLVVDIEKKKTELEEMRSENPKAWTLGYRSDEIRELEGSILPRMRQDLKMIIAMTELVARDRSELSWSDPFDASGMEDALQRWGCTDPEPVLGRVLEALLKFAGDEGYAFTLTPVVPIRG